MINDANGNDKNHSMNSYLMSITIRLFFFFSIHQDHLFLVADMRLHTTMSQISPAKENSHNKPITTQQPPQKAQNAFTMSQISPAKSNSHT